MATRIAYFVNEYPKVSHSFIRREINALERQGHEIFRIALRGWDGELPDKKDRREREMTHYILQKGVFALILPVIGVLLKSPRRFVRALSLALKMSYRSDRPLSYHLMYLFEACRMLCWLKSFRVTHLHAHFGTNSAEVAMLAQELGGPPFSFTAHGPEEFDRPQFIGLAEKIKRAAFVVAISSFGQSQIYRWAAQECWNKVHVVRCGIEPEFSNVPSVPVTTNPRIVCIARLSEEKGQLLLIKAAARLKAKGISFELVFAGDGHLRRQLEATIEKEGLGSNVHITGWLSGDEVCREILAARAIVQPSFAEGLPVVIMEAMALRRPVLSTYVAGIPELVLPDITGWLIPAGSTDALAEAMEMVLRQTPERLQAMGEASRERVMARHSADVEAAKLAELFLGHGVV